MSTIFNPKYHHRRSIRLKEYDYTEPNWYYITICTYKKKNIFGGIIKSKMILNNFGKIVEGEW
jgi:REP-associated tyrosine transposase